MDDLANAVTLKPWEILEPELPFHRMKILPEKTGLSDSQLYELIAKGEFPQPVKIGPRASGVPANWLKAWMLSRVEASARQRRKVI